MLEPRPRLRAAALAAVSALLTRRRSSRVAAIAVLSVAASALVVAPASAGAPTATVTAHVALEGGGSAGQGCVEVYTRDYTSGGSACGTGDISVGGLPSGEYLVGFSRFENGVDEWYRDAATRSDATPVSVVAGATTDVSATLTVGATITGTVTLADGSAPAAGMVEAYDADGRQVSTAFSAGGGAYSLRGLPAGSYYVKFSNFAGAPVIFFGGTGRADATAVPVSAGLTTTLDYQLPLPATLQVTLDTTDPHSATLSGPSMAALSSSGDHLGHAWPDSVTGAFIFSALPDGDIYLQLAPSTDHSFARVHYDGGVNSLADATPVTVTAGGTTSTTFALHAVGTITGSVTRLNDALATYPAAERDVVVYSQEASSGDWVPLECTECGGGADPLATVVTDAAGNFTVGDLLVGDYKVGFRDHPDNEAYQAPAVDFHAPPVAFYGGSDLASATVVHVAAGTTVPGVRAVLQPLAGPPKVAIGWGGGPLTCVDGRLVGAELGWGYDSSSDGELDPALEEQLSRDGIESVTLTQGGHPVTGNNDLMAGDVIITVAVKPGYQYDPARLTDPGTTVNGNVVSFRWSIPPYDGHCAPPTPTEPPHPDAAIHAYVTKVYSDLFHRSPDPTGLVNWTNALKSGTPYGQVANGITGSEEYRSQLIAGTYRRYLGREPEAAGLAFWLGQMYAGRHIEQMQSGFIASDEFYARGGGTDRGWVTLLYQTVLDRSPAPSEVDWWVAHIRNGMSRATVALGFLYSTEHLTAVVDGHYVHLLGRHLDPSGQATWVGQIQAGHRDEEIIAAIVSSAEYRANV